MSPFRIIGVFLAALTSVAEIGPKSLAEVDSGTATFEASTNVPGIEVKGKSSELAAHVEVIQDSAGLTLQRVEASVPVKTLATGMKVRDEHMRKYIFTTSGGQEPDLHFTADTGSCPAQGASREFACQITGIFSIRGVTRPMEIRLRVKQQSSTFRVEGGGNVKLSDFGIPAPSQFGVKPGDVVKFHLDFTARQKPSSSNGEGGGQ